MLPVVALVGRPNVGKSTLFNVLTRTRDALVADLPGVTRDRHYGVCRLGERKFVLVDTGGLADSEEGLAGPTARQVELAIDEADLVVFVVDARDGLLPTDQSIIAKLRRNSKQIVLAVNKTDGLDENLSLSEFARLGVSAAVPMAASHNHGTHKLLDTVLPLLPAQDDEAQEALDDGGVRVAIIGRPNVGKSTLISTISAARPKIANYHFTTLTPVLGVVRVGPEQSFVCADIPGLIEGAADGVGLGHDFLRHVERCRLLLHVVDVSGSECREPIEDFEKINEELAKFSPELAQRPQIVVGRLPRLDTKALRYGTELMK